MIAFKTNPGFLLLDVVFLVIVFGVCIWAIRRKEPDPRRTRDDLDPPSRGDL